VIAGTRIPLLTGAGITALARGMDCVPFVEMQAPPAEKSRKPADGAPPPTRGGAR
jgi:hypothetical protein